MASDEGFDVFLSHSSADKPAVEAIAQRLIAEEHLRPFLDKWHLSPGMPWQDELAVAMAESSSVAVFVGPSGSGPWHHEEMRVALDHAARAQGDFRVIPVLLPGAEQSSVDGFLGQRTWVDFRSGLDDAEAMKRLAAGVRGEAYAPDTFSLPDEPAPYRGLFRFEAKDDWLFFGRDDEIAQLIAKLDASSLVAVVGASGSGKSSLVRAGLIPRLANLRTVTWGTSGPLICTPGSDPFRSLAEQVAQLAPGGSSLQTVDELTERFAGRDDGLVTALGAYTAQDPGAVFILVDQFEELFTQAAGGQWRQAASRFAANLARAAADPRSSVKIVLTLRADFVASALTVDGLAELLQDNQLLLGSLTGDKLRDAIVHPADKVGAFFEKGLVATIVDDVDSEPGALPLLQHALFELWGQRRGPWLTIDAYERTGGVIGALSTTAQSVYDRLPLSQQLIARKVLIRLTTFGEGVPDTRRRAAREELYPVGVDRGDVDAVLAAFGGQDARLIVIEHDTVEVAHEALLRNWAALRGWLDSDRDSLRVHRRLSQATSEWAVEHDPTLLYRGARLAEASEFAEAHAEQLNEVERRFVTAGVAQMGADRDAEQRRLRTLKRRLIAATVAFALAVVGGGVAVVALNNANAATDRAERLAALANSRSLAAASLQVLPRDPGLAALLALEAQRIDPTGEATQATYAVASSPWQRVITNQPVDVSAFSADGSWIVAGDAAGLTLWDSSGVSAATIAATGVASVAISPDGKRIVTVGDDGVLFWDDTGSRVSALDAPGTTMVAFSGEGSLILTAGAIGVVVWDLAGKVVRSLPIGPVRFAALSSYGDRIVTIDGEGTTVLLWDEAGKKTRIDTYALAAMLFYDDSLLETRLLTNYELGLSLFDDNGTQLMRLDGYVDLAVVANHGASIVTVGDDGALVFSTDGDLQQVLTSERVQNWVGVSGDGESLVTAGEGGVVLWHLSNRVLLSSDPARIVEVGPEDSIELKDKRGTFWVEWNGRLGIDLRSDGPSDDPSDYVRGSGSIPFDDVSDSPDGSRSLTADIDGVVLSYDSGAELTLTKRSARMARFSPDGSRIVAVGQWGGDVWDADGNHLVSLTRVALNSAVISSDGTQIVTAGRDGVVVWGVDGERIRTITSAGAYTAAFSGDGSSIVTAGLFGAVLWSAEGRRLANLTNTRAVGATFSPDGSHILVAGDDGAVLVRVWDVAALEGELERRLGGRRLTSEECEVYFIDPCPAAESGG